MASLLILIYLAFISLGLPDSVLGSAWPSMYGGFGVPVSAAGIVSMIISGGTIISSLNSAKLIRRFGTGRVTTVSVAMTAFALLGISVSQGFVLLCLLAVPLGLGAGSVDTALNDFVSLHYRASHMSWLHSFWGLGASLGPVIMSSALIRQGSLWGGWQGGYRTIGVLQTALAAVLLMALPLWNQAKNSSARKESPGDQPPGLLRLIRLPKVLPALSTFFFYCSLEATVGLWGASYLVIYRGLPSQTAAAWVALYYGGITAGRMLGGFISLKVTQRMMIRLGLSLIALGIACLIMPAESAALAGLFLIGLGCAPIFPAMMHETPRTFGEENSRFVIGLQMAGAYLGSTLMPPLFGLVGAAWGYGLLPAALGLFFALMILTIKKVFAGRTA